MFLTVRNMINLIEELTVTQFDFIIREFYRIKSGKNYSSSYPKRRSIYHGNY